MILSFKDYLKESVSANTHMTHLEDLVFEAGVEGTRRAIFFLRDLRDMLSQSTGNKKTITTTKWDGSPAIFCGINPENGKFFIAKKGLFNKNPKLYYSHEDIDADTTGDLAYKLKVAFDECKKLGIKTGVYQGDILFTQKDLKQETIDGKDYITFHPNTIVYAVPIDSKLASEIKKAPIGIVWHTSYSGDSLANLSASFGKPITPLFNKTSAWMVDATIKDVSGVATFTDSERKQFDILLSEIGSLFRSTSAQALNSIHKDKDLLELIHIFNNSKIRIGKKIEDTEKHVDELYQFIEERFNKELQAKKTEKGKQTVTDRKIKILNFFLTYPKKEIVKIFELNKKLAEAKNFIIKKLNQISDIGTFLKTSNGFKVTTPEGYVAISDQGAVKLVDRLEFSYANFSPEILRGWNK